MSRRGERLYLAVLGFLIGTAVERMRFDARRASVLSRLTGAERQVRARLMDLEGASRQPERGGRATAEVGVQAARWAGRGYARLSASF